MHTQIEGDVKKEWVVIVVHISSLHRYTSQGYEYMGDYPDQPGLVRVKKKIA